MNASTGEALQKQQPLTGNRKFWARFRRNWMLHSMMVLPMVYYILFEALPLYGLQVAFREYTPDNGIFGSQWVGLAHYIDFFSRPEWSAKVINTLVISFYQIGVGFPIPIFLALVLHINQKNGLKKLTQNVAYIPHFISVVVMVGMLHQIFHPNYGVITAISRLVGGNSVITDIRFEKSSFRHLYVWSGVWQNMGWSTIVYVAALSGVSNELHEAAKIDGASRWRRVLSVDLPAIMPTISIMLIMRFGSILSVGYEKVYLMQSTENKPVSDVISTYVYERGIRKGKHSYGTAIGLLNSAINSGMVILVNKISSWLTDGEAGLF